MADKNSSIIYRPLTVSDMEAVISLHMQLIPSAGARMGTAYLQRLYKTLFTQHHIHLIVGAFKDTRLVGFISATEKLPNVFIIPLIPTIFIGLIQNTFSIQELVDHAVVESHIKRLLSTNTRYIVNLAVDSKVQRSGIATELVKRISNKKIVLVDTQKKNIGAQKFYKKIGFSPIAEVADSIIFTDSPSAFQ